MRPRLTAIHGDGIAACACAKLLQKHGLPAAFTRNSASGGPNLLINASTHRLINDVFEIESRFFEGMPTVRRRVVLWGDEPRADLPHEGVVVHQAWLLNKLWERVGPTSHGEPDWEILSHSSIHQGTIQHFGSRMAHVAPAQIKESAADACWVESVADGWLFLLPSGEGSASLIAMGQDLQHLLAQSRLVGPQIACLFPETAHFEAYPRILDPLCGPGWLACGSGAMSFDPICGEGVGNALREAILVGAVLQTGAMHSLLEDYSSRLLLGFLRHLNACRRFYASGKSDWWRSQLAALDTGINWTSRSIAELPKPQYRIVDFRLEPVA